MQENSQPSTLTRKELYDLVWAKPIQTLSKELQITDFSLRKICKKMNIPLPKSGHWSKLKFDKELDIVPLATNYKGEEKVSMDQNIAQSEFIDLIQSPLKKLQLEIEADLKSKLKVPNKLNSSDPLINAAQKILTSDKAKSHYYSGVVSSYQNALDIRVAPKNIGRALRFMDTFIKALRHRGNDILTRYDKTYAVVKGQEFQIMLHEKMTKVVVNERNWERTEYHPINILAFKVESYPKKEFKDGKQQTIEDQIARILANLEQSAEEWNEWRAQQDEKDRIRKEKEQLERDLITRQENELTAFKSLLNKAKRWSESKIIREYIFALESDAANKDMNVDFQNWILWARNKADWYDPMIELPDEQMTRVDIETLTFKKEIPTPFKWN